MAETPPSGASDVLKKLLKNPATRKMVLNTARKAASGVASRVQRRSGTAGTSTGNGAGGPEEPSVAKPSTSGWPLPLGNLSSSVEAIVSQVAKPAAHKLAGTSAGRSVLEAVRSLTSEALDEASPKKVQSSRVGAAAADEPQQPKVNFVPVQPKAAAGPPPEVETMRWPPPKHSETTSSSS